MIYLGIASIATSCILAIAGFSWVYVTRWELLRRMAEIQRSEIALAELKTRIYTIENKPEAGLEEHKKILIRFENVESTVRLLKSSIENEAEIARRNIAKLSARQTRAEPDRVPETPIAAAAGKSAGPEEGFPAAAHAFPLFENSHTRAETPRSPTFGKTLTGRT